jgi:V8-like Glu-specific endopeptidase
MRRMLAFLTASVLLLALVPAVVSAATERSRPTAAAAANPVLAFWTAARIRAAVPLEMVFDADGNLVSNAAGGNGRGKPTPGPTPVPTDNPGDPGGGGGPAPDSTGTSYASGGDVVNGVGRVFFVSGAFLYSCSGTVVQDGRADYSLVLTAGHCVIDKGKFATNWMFIPNYDAISSTSFTDCLDGSNACWVASGLYVNSTFASQKRFNNTAVLNDFAFAVIGKSGHSQTLDQTYGSFGITFSGPSVGTTLAAFGYPAGAPYTGNDLTYCQGPIGEDPNTGNGTWSMSCDMTGGSSGGGWLSGDYTDFGLGLLRSLNSYGYSGDTHMYGPKFNGSTQAVYDAADGDPTIGNTIVP